MTNNNIIKKVHHKGINVPMWCTFFIGYYPCRVSRDCGGLLYRWIVPAMAVYEGLFVEHIGSLWHPYTHACCATVVPCVIWNHCQLDIAKLPFPVSR